MKKMPAMDHFLTFGHETFNFVVLFFLLLQREGCVMPEMTFSAEVFFPIFSP